MEKQCGVWRYVERLGEHGVGLGNCFATHSRRRGRNERGEGGGGVATKKIFYL